MDLLIIRHGQSEADILNVFEGRADFPLTALGEEQARRMAGWVSEAFPVERIIASPLRRAARTAQILSDAAGVPLSLDDDLMEFQNGLVAGMPYEEGNRLYPPPNPRYLHTKAYGQESGIEFRARAETALSRILNESDPDSTIAVVSHGGMINMLYRSFLSLPMDSGVSVSTGDTGIHHWRVEGAKRIIRFANRLAHLN